MKQAHMVEGRAACFTAAKRQVERNRLSKQLYETMILEVWDYLHELGYFDMKNYGAFYDLSGGKKSDG